jgi:hypothetical protein
MHPLLAVLLLSALWGLPAAAEIYRCEDAAGGIHFVDDPSLCTGAKRYVPTREIVRAAPDRERPARPHPTVSLEDLLPGASEIGPEWDITREVGNTRMDPDQQRMGMVEIQARHYGRSVAGVTEVCSIELWRFANASQAAAAEAGSVYPGWSFEAKGPLLITLRGTRWQRSQPFRKGLFPDCRKLGALVKSP